MAISLGAVRTSLPTPPSEPVDTAASAARAAPAVNAARVAAVRKDYAELQGDLGRVLENSIHTLRDELRATQQSASPLFKSRVLYRAFSKAAGLVEQAFHLKTDSLKYRFLRNAPLLTATERCLGELKLAARETGALNRSLEEGTAAQAAGDRVEHIFNRLLDVSETISRPLGGDANQQTWASLTSAMVQLSHCVYASYQLDDAITRTARASADATLRTPAASPAPKGSATTGTPAQGSTRAPRAGDVPPRPVLQDAGLVRLLERQVDLEQQLGFYADTFNPLVEGKSKQELAQVDAGDVHGTLDALRRSEQELSELRGIVDGQLKSQPGNTVLQQWQAALDYDLALLAEFRPLISSKKPLPVYDRRETPDALGIMRAVTRDQDASPKLVNIHPDPRFRDANHFHNQPTPEKPVGNNPLFYREVQEYRLCLKHAMNNCLGGEVVTDAALAESVYNKVVNGYLTMAREEPHHFIHECAEFGFDPAPSLEQAQGQSEAYAKQMADIFFAQVDGPLEYVRHGNDAGQAVNLFNEKQEELGIPEARLHNLDTHEQVVGFLEQAQQTTDRMIVGTGQHFIAFRKAADGDWFKLDSGGPQQRQTPLEFVQQHGPQENLGAGIRKYDFVVFSEGDFVAKIPEHPAPERNLLPTDTV